jgi:hypothetical protein
VAPLSSLAAGLSGAVRTEKGSEEMGARVSGEAAARV